MRPLPYRLVALAAGLLLVVSGGCGDDRKPPTKPRSAPEFGKVINPDPNASPYVKATELVYVCGWGSSGRLAGRTVYRDGLVREWEKEPDKEQEVELKRWRARPDLAAAVFQAAQQVAFLELDFREYDDLGCKLKLIWPEGEHTVSWKIRGLPLHVHPILRAISGLHP